MHPAHRSWPQRRYNDHCQGTINNTFLRDFREIPQERVVGWFLDSGHYSAAEAKTYELDAYSCLREREIMCDVLMSDYIGSHIGEVYLFHTFNHPVDKLLYELAIRILRLAGKGMGKIDPTYFRPNSRQPGLIDHWLPCGHIDTTSSWLEI